jgi:hypothetical protein
MDVVPAEKAAQIAPDAVYSWNPLGGVRRWYDRAVQWVDGNKPNDEELRRFRAEAEELLGIKPKRTQDTKKEASN